jgi:hypothetical protein
VRRCASRAFLPPEAFGDLGKAAHYVGVDLAHHLGSLSNRHLSQVNAAGRPYAAPDASFLRVI